MVRKRIAWMVITFGTAAIIILAAYIGSADVPLITRVSPLLVIVFGWPVLLREELKILMAEEAKIGVKISGAALWCRIANLGPPMLLDRVILRWHRSSVGKSGPYSWIELSREKEYGVSLKTADFAVYSLIMLTQIPGCERRYMNEPTAVRVLSLDGTQAQVQSDVVAAELVKPEARPRLEVYTAADDNKPLVVLESKGLMPYLKELNGKVPKAQC